MSRKLSEAAGVDMGDMVTLEIMPVGEEPEPRVTRARRIGNACEILAAGKRRVSCFDRSGFYRNSFGAPEAAD